MRLKDLIDEAAFSGKEQQFVDLLQDAVWEAMEKKYIDSAQAQKVLMTAREIFQNKSTNI